MIAICQSCDAALYVERRGERRLRQIIEEAGLIPDDDEPPLEILCPECADHEGDLFWLTRWRLAS